MSYDIYGNPLQRGHCEVHPHVAEEYPCSVCMADKRQRDTIDRYEEAQVEEHQQLEAKLYNMILAFKAHYASHNPQHSEPSDSYLLGVLNGDHAYKHSDQLRKAAKRRETLANEIESMTGNKPSWPEA